jgi:hypothetical protein
MNTVATLAEITGIGSAVLSGVYEFINTDKIT